MKKFGDLKKGDSVFLVMLGPEKWIIHTLKVLRTGPGLYDDNIKVDLDNEAWSGYYPKEFISSRNNFLWSDREEAIKFALENARKERDYLNRKIDKMISVYDEIEKLIEKYE